MFCSTAEHATKPVQAYQAARFDETYWTQSFHNGTAQIYLAQASLELLNSESSAVTSAPT